jgi:hypothetical protein
VITRLEFEQWEFEKIFQVEQMLKPEVRTSSRPTAADQSAGAAFPVVRTERVWGRLCASLIVRRVVK